MLYEVITGEELLVEAADVDEDAGVDRHRPAAGEQAAGRDVVLGRGRVEA